MAIVNGPKVRSVGSSSYPLTAIGAHIFKRDYYKHAGASGDVRGEYQDLTFTSTGSGETLRLRGIANATGVAAGGTINALHATGRVASSATVSGQLNAIRATLEVAGTTPSPGGTLAALMVDTNISTGWTAPSTASFIHVGNIGAGLVSNLFYINDAIGDKSDTALVTTVHAGSTHTHSIKINVAGTILNIMCSDNSNAS